MFIDSQTAAKSLTDLFTTSKYKNKYVILIVDQLKQADLNLSTGNTVQFVEQL